MPFIRWRRTGQTRDLGEIAGVRRLIWTELVLVRRLAGLRRRHGAGPWRTQLMVNKLDRESLTAPSN